jgi:hypothetical protein
MIAHEHVKRKLSLLNSQIRRDIHFGMVAPLVAFKESQPPDTALLQHEFLDARMVPPADELPPLSLGNTLTDLGESWTTAVYQIYCDVWSEQNQSKTESFILDVWYEGVAPWIRDELPSLLCCALSWAMPGLRIETMRNNAPVKYQIDYCKNEPKLAGVARTCKLILDRWPYTKIYEERGHTRIPPVDAFTIQMEESQKIIDAARTTLANANSGKEEKPEQLIPINTTQAQHPPVAVDDRGPYEFHEINAVIAPKSFAAMRKSPGLTFSQHDEVTLAEDCNHTMSQVAYTLNRASTELRKIRAFVGANDVVTPEVLRKTFSDFYLITSRGADNSDLRGWIEDFSKGPGRATANNAALVWCERKIGLSRNTLTSYKSRWKSERKKKSTTDNGK